jgi:hypothetical protein
MVRSWEEMEDLLKLYQHRINSLYKDLTDATIQRNRKPCDHITLRPAYMCCPHPECLSIPGSGNRIYVMRPPNTWFRMDIDSDQKMMLDEECWERGELRVNLEKFWTWRRVDPNAPTREN